MKNYAYDDYRDNDSFLELVDKYKSENDNDFEEIQNAIATDVRSWLREAHGDKYDVAMYLSEAKSLINVLQYINDERDEDE